MFYVCNMNEIFVNKWKSQVKKGTLTFIVLNVLKKNEFYGYEFIEEIKKLTSIEIAEGTFYPLMNRLKKENLVSSKWVEQESGIPRKYYVLTKTGDETLKQMQFYWEELSKSIKKISNEN
ncbi:PadR family transcriptional regulator [Flavobacterium rhizosphaerae]|uniref:PadR family transcriptional regulator n=1 Tax=Flavobacterium rhizosphaerae TaxID=3163298 RepID=A0ABW8YXQ2_9FLAO